MHIHYIKYFNHRSWVLVDEVTSRRRRRWWTSLFNWSRSHGERREGTNIIVGKQVTLLLCPCTLINIIMAHGAPLLSPSATAPTSSTAWWENMHANSLRWPAQSPPSVHRRSSSSYDEASISNAAVSHCSALSMDSSSGGEPADNHRHHHRMWSHLLLWVVNSF